MAVLPVFSCGCCRYCAAGAVSHCAQTRTRDGSGGRIRRVRRGASPTLVPATHRYPQHDAALVEPFAVGLHGVHSAEVAPGEEVVIVGAGGVGLTTLAWALPLGAHRVTVVDPDPRRGGSALAMGATDALASVAEADAGAYDAALECAGR